jgi:hypothetical protein
MLILVRETSEETDPAEREGKVRSGVVSGDHQTYRDLATAIAGCKVRVKKIFLVGCRAVVMLCLVPWTPILQTKRTPPFFRTAVLLT